jgi:hypothetical protein
MSSAKITLVLGSHAHVPYGADTGEFEKAYAELLKPFISSLYKYPKVQAALHYSGVLLHWVERSHPELLMLIEDMVGRKQVEMLGGGFYEPILPIIPLQDKIGQIELLTTYLRKHFGKRPQGCWLPCFTWEQGMVSPLAACGMGFTFLSERQFVLANSGHAVDIVDGSTVAPCICEDQGKLITVFPVLQSLEESLASKGIAAMLENFRRKHSEEAEPVVSIFPPRINTGEGESAESAWYRFFDDLSLCESFTETVMPGKIAKGLKNPRKLNIPDSSVCVEGMSPRRFIIVHPEAGGIYSKMIFTNVLINQLRGDKSRKLSAHEELWKAQSSVLFCRAGSQGLHNHVLRNAAYGALLAAERLTREKVKFTPSLVPFDFNLDGTPEWLFQDTRINCYVQSLGGSVFELDYLPTSWNYADTCGGRLAFADRLLPSSIKLDKLNVTTTNVGTTNDETTIVGVSDVRNCRNEYYEPVNLDKVRRSLRLLLSPAPVPFGNIEIEKKYTLKKDSVCVAYFFVNRGTAAESFQFSPEIDLALGGEGDTFTRFFACKTGQADVPLAQPLLRDADGLKIHDIKNEVQITLSANQPFSAKISPVYVPDKETGANLFQALCVMPLVPFSLEPGGKGEIEFTLRFSH